MSPSQFTSNTENTISTHFVYLCTEDGAYLSSPITSVFTKSIRFLKLSTNITTTQVWNHIFSAYHNIYDIHMSDINE